MTSIPRPCQPFGSDTVVPTRLVIFMMFKQAKWTHITKITKTIALFFFHVKGQSFTQKSSRGELSDTPGSENELVGRP